MTSHDDIVVSASEAQYELLPAGAYRATVTAVERFDGTDFRTGEPRPAVRLVFTVEKGPYAGTTVDRLLTLPTNLANERAKLHEFFKGITGVTPEPGQSYGLRQWLLGRRCTILVEHHTNQRGQTWARVASVAPLASSAPTAKGGQGQPAPAQAPAQAQRGTAAPARPSRPTSTAHLDDDPSLDAPDEDWDDMDEDA